MSIVLDVDREHHPIQPDRARGNTFRRIMESFLQASAGNHVYFIVNDENMRRWTAYKMMDLLLEYFRDMFDTSCPDKGRIEFPGRGFVRIVTKYEWDRHPVPSDVTASYTIIEMDDCYVK